MSVSVSASASAPASFRYSWSRPFEAAGCAFFQQTFRDLNAVANTGTGTGAGTEPANRQGARRAGDVDSAAADEAEAGCGADVEEMNQERIEELIEAKDYYRLLGLKNGLKSTSEEIRKYYRQMLLKYHPDKTGVTDDDPHFLSIQAAYATLSDAEKRRGFDSHYEFDEAFPTARETTADNFFELWAPVFERNARFSQAPRAPPPLGGPEASRVAVADFWAFWRGFLSWRDFSWLDEHTTSAGDSREDKRYYAQQNLLNRRKLKRREAARLQRLVDTAFRLDPRRKRFAEEAARDKQQAKDRGERHRQEQQQREKEAREAAERDQEETRQRDRDARKAAKEARKALNRAKREVRLKLQEKCRALEPALTEQDFVDLANTSDLDCLNEFLGEAIRTNSVVAVSARIRELRQQAAEAAMEAQRRKEEARKAQDMAKAAAAARASRPWTKAEESWLAKAMVKIPAGTRRRWAEVADFMVQVGKCEPRRPKECVAHAEKLKKEELLCRAQKNRTKGAPGTSTGTGTGTGTAAGTSKGKGNVKPAQAAASAWSQEQQTCLEKALGQFPSTMNKKARWKAIAQAVAGKSMKDCIARVKFIRAQLLKK